MTKGSVAKFFDDCIRPFFGHTYAASAANCWNAVSSLASSCPFRIICVVSIPAKVASAEWKALKPSIAPPLSSATSVTKLLPHHVTRRKSKKFATEPNYIAWSLRPRMRSSNGYSWLYLGHRDTRERRVDYCHKNADDAGNACYAH